MRPLSFIPGPSKLSEAVVHDITRAAETGVLELSHRSSDFISVAEKSQQHLRALLNVPDTYQVLYLDSASSAWHSIIANIVTQHSAHIVTGAFSGKAADAAANLFKATSVYTIDITAPTPTFPEKIDPQAELVTLCYSESSNGSRWSDSELHRLRNVVPEALIAVDVTSCAGAIPLPIADADAWYFSVQKAFGLPAGLGVLILSPHAIKRAEVLLAENKNLAGMWAWPHLLENQTKGRGPTPHTPNMLGIYLLEQQCQRYLTAGGIATLHKDTLEKVREINRYLDTQSTWRHYVPDQGYRSPTVITLAGTPEEIIRVHQRAATNNVQLGTGYGDLRDTTIRIANFPALSKEDMQFLLSWL